MPKNEGLTESWEQTFSSEVGELIGPDGNREAVHTCWTCSALVTYWRRREHHAWHRALATPGLA